MSTSPMPSGSVPEILDDHVTWLRQRLAALESPEQQIGGFFLTLTRTTADDLRNAIERVQSAIDHLCSQEEPADTPLPASASTRMQQMLFELAADATFVTDAEGAILHANRATNRLIRSLRQHVIGKPLPALVMHEDRERAAGLVERAAGARMGEVCEARLRFPAVHGPARQTQVRVTRLDAAGGRARELLWCIREVSKEQRLRERVADLEGARERYERELQMETAAILRLRDAARDQEQVSLRAMLDAAVERSAVGEPGAALEALLDSLRDLVDAPPPLFESAPNERARLDKQPAIGLEEAIVQLRAGNAVARPITA